MQPVFTLLALSALAAIPGEAAHKTASPQVLHVETYTAKDFTHLIGISGFSEEAISTHLSLYKGYVNNLNLLLQILQQGVAENKQATPAYQEMKRRIGWEYDGVRLHELYFENLGKENSQSPLSSTPLMRAIVGNFGSFEAWKKDFSSTGMLRGIGWVILYQEPISHKLLNIWIGEHDIGHLAGGTPLLIMDIWEHAYLLDYKLDRKAYIETFCKHIDWEVVGKRYSQVNET